MRSQFLYEPDPEIERTFCLRRKKQKIKEHRREARLTSTKMAGGGGGQKRTLRDFVTAGVQGIASSITHPNGVSTDQRRTLRDFIISSSSRLSFP